MNEFLKNLYLVDRPEMQLSFVAQRLSYAEGAKSHIADCGSDLGQVA